MTPRKLSTLFLAIATAAISGCVHAPGTTPPIAAIAPSALISPIEHAPVPTDQPYDCGPPVPVGTDITVATTAPLDEDVKAAVYNESAGVLQEFPFMNVSSITKSGTPPTSHPASRSAFG